jgi:hypothetical protein
VTPLEARLPFKVPKIPFSRQEAANSRRSQGSIWTVAPIEKQEARSSVKNAFECL